MTSRSGYTSFGKGPSKIRSLQHILFVVISKKRSRNHHIGGHDHEVVCRFAGDWDENPNVIPQGQFNDAVFADGKVICVEGDVRMVESGSDWKSYSVVDLMVGRYANGAAYLQTIKLTQFTDITRLPSYKTLSTPAELSSILASVHARITHAVQHPLLHTRVPLDGRSSVIRSQETNLGNMLVDAVLTLIQDT